MKDNKTLLDVAHALMLLVEGPGCARWEDGHGFRLKDMPEWAAFYCAVKACALERDTIAAERDALAAEVGALRLDAERWQTIRDSRSSITLSLHCTAPSERERFIDALRAEAGQG